MTLTCSQKENKAIHLLKKALINLCSCLEFRDREENIIFERNRSEFSF